MSEAPYRVAIIGSREYPDLRRVAAYVDRLPPGTVVVSGGARVVDAFAVGCARQRNLPVEVIRADWDHLGRRAGMLRNETLVAAVDRVTAFWNHHSRGTAHAIAVSLRKQKPVRVCGLNGEIAPEDVKARVHRILNTGRPKREPRGEAPADVHDHRTRMLRRWSKRRRA